MKYIVKATRVVLAIILTVNLTMYTISAEISESNESAELLSEVGIFNGSDIGFELNREPSRLEGLVMIIRLLGEEEKVLSYEIEEQTFIDVPAWGEQYVQYAYDNGLAQGISEDEFGSDLSMDSKTYMTLVLRGLGYDDSVGDFSWHDAVDKSIEVGIVDEKEMEALEDFTRGDLAEVSLQALKVEVKDSEKLLIEELVDNSGMTRSDAKTLGITIEKPKPSNRVVVITPEVSDQIESVKKQPTEEKSTIQVATNKEAATQVAAAKEAAAQAVAAKEAAAQAVATKEAAAQAAAVKKVAAQAVAAQEAAAVKESAAQVVAEKKEATQAAEDKEAAAGVINVKSFGAVGDGVTDDTKAIIDLLQYCDVNNKTAYFSEGNYSVNDRIMLPNVNLVGDNATITVNGLVTTGGGYSRFALVGDGATLDITGIDFVLNSNTHDILGLYRCDNINIEDCTFTVNKGIIHNGYVDLYTDNKNISFDKCDFNDNSNTEIGGVWIRNINAEGVTDGISFEDCKFNHSTSDEIIAIWGWFGTVQNVSFVNTELKVNDAATMYSTNCVSIGNYATTKNVTFSGCTIENNHVDAALIKAYNNKSRNNVNENFTFTNCTIKSAGIETSRGYLIKGNTDDDEVLQFINCKFEFTSGNTRTIFESCTLTDCDVVATTNTLGVDVTYRGGTITKTDGIVIKDGCTLEGVKIVADTLRHFLQPTVKGTTNIIRDCTIEVKAMPSIFVYSNRMNDTLIMSGNSGCGKVQIELSENSLIYDNEFITSDPHKIDNTVDAYDNRVNGIFIKENL